MTGWWCGKSSTSQKSSTSGSQNSKNSMFELVFNGVAETLMHFKRLSIFNEDNTLQNDDDVFYAYYCSKIGNQEIREKIKNWICKKNNKKRFLRYFTERANPNNPDLIEKEVVKNSNNFICFMIYFDFALFCNLKNKDVTQCLTFILRKEKIIYLLLLQLNLLEIEKNSLITDKSIKRHFEEKFDHYFPLLQNDQFWQSKGNLSGTKLRLAQVLKQSRPTRWKNEKWEEVTFQKYKEPFSRNAFSHSNDPSDQNLLDAQKKWILEEFRPRMFEFRLWQKLRKPEKMPEFIFGQIFSEDHLNILKDYIQRQNKPEECLIDILLFCHEDLRPVVKKWVEKLKQNLKQISDNEKEEKLKDILMTLMTMKVVLDL